MKHLSYLGVIVVFFSFLNSLYSQITISGEDYSIRPLFELDQLATGEAYPWISDDGLRIYYTAFNELDSVYSIWCSERSDISSNFDSHYLLDVNSYSVDNLSAWLSADEKTIAFVRRDINDDCDTRIYLAQRQSVEDVFENAKAIQLPEKIKGTLLSPSFTPDLQELIVFNEYKGHSYILRFERDSELNYVLKSELDFGNQFVVKSGNLSTDGLEYFISLQEGRRNPSLWSLKRESTNEDFSIVNKVISPVINDKRFRNHQAYFSSEKNFIVFTQSSFNEWDQNGIFIVQRNKITAIEKEEVLTSIVNLDDIKAFPNPSIDYVYFRGINDLNIQIDVFDSAGRKVRQLQSVQDDQLVDISALKAGSYYFRIMELDHKAYKIIKHIKL